MSIRLKEDDTEDRFFTSEKAPDKDATSHHSNIIGITTSEEDVDSEDATDKSCLTLRLLQKLCPCVKNQSVWEASQGDVFKTQEVAETKYPKILQILESPIVDFLTVISSILSIYGLFFSLGFIEVSRALWGSIHLINTVFSACILAKWLEILVKSKYAKTNQMFTTQDVIISIICILPVDIIVLIMHVLSQDNTTTGNNNPVTKYIAISRINYMLRWHFVLKCFTKWEDRLMGSVFKMFAVRFFVYILTIVHLNACLFHRIACEPFQMTHLKLKPIEATFEVCSGDSWVIKMVHLRDNKLLQHEWMVLVEQYLVSMFWGVLTSFGFNTVGITVSLKSNYEITYTSVAEISSWIFFVVFVSGSLTAMLVELDKEKMNFLTRRFAINKFLEFNEISKAIKQEVNRYYDHLWSRSKGIQAWNMLDEIPFCLRSEIYYNLNKFILDQIPLLAHLDETFLTGLSVHIKHRFFLRGEILRRKNETGSSLFYVINGFLEILDDGDTWSIAEINSGSAIGEIYLLQSYPQAATIRCGTECDIMVLEKADFKKVLNLYPSYLPTLLQRLETKFEKTGLLIALSEKHNEYPKAFRRLKDLQTEEVRDRNEMTPTPRKSIDASSAGIGSGGLVDLPFSEDDARFSASEEYDGLLITHEIQKRLTRSVLGDRNRKSAQKDAAVAAYLALEADVLRAATLAKELNILRPPLFLIAPSFCQTRRKGFVASESKRRLNDLVPKLTSTKRSSVLHIFYKTVAFFSATFIIWYYPYMFGFSNRYKSHYVDYIAHAFDVVFALDFLYDHVQPVVTPHGTLNSFSAILKYHATHLYTYVRIFSFLPLEYGISAATGITSYNSRYFYCFKFNRLFQFAEMYKYKRIFQNGAGLLPSPRYFIVQISYKFFFVVHVFAVVYEIILFDVCKNEPVEGFPELGNSTIRNYEFSMYWAIQLITTTGADDVPMRTDEEIALTVLGLFIGSVIIYYFPAKIAASLSLQNSFSRRVDFKNIYCSLTNFMRSRKLPAWLYQRVNNYYQLQWKSNEGALILQQLPILFDAPKTLFENVSLALSVMLVARIPLFRYCKEDVLVEVCTSLRPYTISPNEVILHANERSRELYIIVKGVCEVRHENNVIGTLTNGQYFGIPGLIYGINRPVKIQSLTYCQLFCLEFERFVKIANKCPPLLQDYKILRGEAKLLMMPETELGVDAYKELEIPMPAQNQIYPLFEVPSTSITDLTTPSVLSNKPSLGNLESQQIPQNKSKFSVCRLFLIPKTISPTGTFLTWWTVFRLISAFTVANFALIQATFPINPTFSFFFMLVFDIIAWIDMYLCLHIGYFGSQSQLISDPLKTASHYLRGSFLVDIAGCFPLEYIVMMSYPTVHPFASTPDYGGYYYLISCLRLNRIIQTCRLVLSAQHLEKTIFRSLSLMTTLQIAPLFLTFLTFTTCSAVLLVCELSINGGSIVCRKDAWIINTDGILFRYSEPNLGSVLDGWRSFLIGLHWVIDSISFVGIGDIEILNSPLNRQIGIALFYFGTIATSYLMGDLTACLIGEEAIKIEIREKTKIMARILKQFHVPVSLRRRVNAFYAVTWDKAKGINPKELMNALPPMLKADVLRNLYQQKIHSCPLFATLDDPGFRILASILTEADYPEGEYITKFGDLDNDVFLIAHGIVGLFTEQEELICYLDEGSMVGEISTFLDVLRLFTVIAVTDVKAYAFKKNDFLDFLSMYPTVNDTIETACTVHYKEARRLATEASDGLKVLLSADVDAELMIEREGRGPRLKENQVKANVKFDIPGVVTSDNVEIKVGDSDLQQGQLGDDKNINDPNDREFADPLRIVRVLVKDSFKYAKDLDSYHKKRPWWNIFVTFGHIPKFRNGLVHIVQEREQANLWNFAIHPASPICSYVSIYLIIACLSCSLTMYEIAFSNGETPDRINITILRGVIEAFFIIRTIGCLHLAFYNKEGALVIGISQIFKRYAGTLSGLFLDVIASFPMYLVHIYYDDIGRGESYAFDTRIFQLCRLFLFARYLQERESNAKMQTGMTRAIKMTILMVLILHFCACAWYIIACDGFTCTRGSWFYVVVQEMIDRREIKHEKEVGQWSRYLQSMYFVSNVITFTGLSEITARTNMELVVSIIMITTTLFVIAFLIGALTDSLASVVSLKMHYRHRLRVMEAHFVELRLHKSKIQNVRDYFRLLWSSCNGFSYSELFKEIPYPLRADILHKLYGPNIKSSRIFGKLDDNVIRELCSRVRHQMYTPGTHIIRSRDACVAVYFIKRGEVVILDETVNMELCVEILYENECFGEIKVMLSQEQFRFSYVARLETEIGVLHRDDIEYVLHHHPGVYEDVLERSNRVKSHRLAMKAQEDNAELTESHRPHGSMDPSITSSRN